MLVPLACYRKQLTELRAENWLGRVNKALFLAEKEVRCVSLPKAAGSSCRLQLSRERVLVPDLSALSTRCSPPPQLISFLDCCCYATKTSPTHLADFALSYLQILGGAKNGYVYPYTLK